jgi:hypothetical protein
VSEPYHLVIKAQARRALEHQLAPSTAVAVRTFIAGPLDIADRSDTAG